MQKRDPLGFINIHSVAKYQKTRRGTLLRHEKNSKKVAQCRKMKGMPLVSSSFVGYLAKVKNERGTLCNKFALAGLGLSGIRSFSKKWTDQCESEEKKGHCKSRAFSLKGKSAD